MERWGLSDQLNIVQGDIRTFNLNDYGPFDLITLYNLIYYFEPGERLDLIKNLKLNLSPEGKIAVLITVQSNGKDSASANLNLANCSLKGVSPVPELTSLVKLFKESGFRKIDIESMILGSSFYLLLAS